jgi:hypothetical protein
MVVSQTIGSARIRASTTAPMIVGLVDAARPATTCFRDRSG